MENFHTAQIIHIGLNGFNVINLSGEEIITMHDIIETSQKILGKNYTVISSVGHIMDLSKKKMGIDTETWKASYVISPDKKDVVKTPPKENGDLVHVVKQNIYPNMGSEVTKNTSLV